MLAQPALAPPDSPEWAFEVKWDGVRVVARSAPGSVRLRSRKRNDVTDGYPELQGLGDALGERSAILDGEVVVLDSAGRPSFQLLQSRIHQRRASAVRHLLGTAPVTYMIFDLLWLDGEPLLDLPYLERRRRLDQLDLDGPRWRVPEQFIGHGAALLQATREQGLEGIVAKRLDSPYKPGKRGPCWQKIKNLYRQEFVIAGWTDGERGRAGRIGALELGYYEAGELRYAGRVGTGFDACELDTLAELLAPLHSPASPFAGAQPDKPTHFAAPDLVCEVEYAAWTRDGVLRNPSYKGRRTDKAARDVAREVAA